MKTVSPNLSGQPVSNDWKSGRPCFPIPGRAGIRSLRPAALRCFCAVLAASVCVARGAEKPPPSDPARKAEIETLLKEEEAARSKTIGAPPKVDLDPAKAAEIKQILKEADEARGNLKGVKWTVDIDAVDNGKKYNNSMNVSARGYDFLAIFTEPAKAKGQRVLFVERNMWYTKPGVKKPVPISSRQKLVGGAAYGDIAATDFANDYNAVPLPDETVDGVDCYVFDLSAANSRTTYDRVKYWVSKERKVGVKAEYYAVSGKMFKSARFEFDESVTVDGVNKPFISKIVITDTLIRENITTMKFSSPKMTPLSDAMFDVNLLMGR